MASDWMVVEINGEITFAAHDHALSLPRKILHVLVGGPVLGFPFGVLAAVRTYVIGLLSCGCGHLVGGSKLKARVLGIAVKTDLVLHCA